MQEEAKPGMSTFVLESAGCQFSYEENRSILKKLKEVTVV
jgi:hypothetical protein